MSIFEAMVLEQALVAMTQRAEQAEQALATMKQSCVWRKNDSGWFEMSCGGAPYTTRLPKFCPNCGHRIEVAE